jgi:3'-phosphoadenosine 5'-phosphosulfate sulfotransferase (PAPS reductase)/FAD synthetase
VTPLAAAGLIAHARTPGFERRLNEALALVERGFEACPGAYVSLSLGKDSSALARLVLSVRPGTPCRFLRWEGETEHLDNYDEVLALWRDRLGVEVQVVTLSRETLEGGGAERWEALADPSGEGHPGDVGYFAGLRAEESHGRRMSLRTHGPIYRNRAGVWRLCPLAGWSGTDVAAHLRQTGTPVLRSYEMEGMGHRTSARVPRAAHGIRAKALERVRAHNPAGYNALLARFPELEGLG